MPEPGNQTLFTSQSSVARSIERLLLEARVSVDAALYRITNPRLARALGKARDRGLRVRLLVDRNKYQATAVTRKLIAENSLPFQAIYGRKEKGSKLHHKFAVLDGHIVLTGSYNWTLDSEERNFDHMLVLRDTDLVLAYQQEFERLWSVEVESSTP
ncbi:MAG: phospholipase D-like domain-containing protein [Terriglobia bacterium]|jgi:phosphatidylserine/phosphatidylglycerophosphate/cardiolipin synthase-like enzyme